MAGQSPDSPAARVDANVASSPYAGVGSVTIGGSTYSGVLIAPGYVLTAAHVANGVSASQITFNLNASGSMSQSIGASAVFINPKYTGPNSSGSPADADLAIIKLSQDAAPSVPYYSLYTADVALGTTFTLVGYGDSGNGNTGAITVAASPSVKRVGQNNADMIGASQDGMIAKALYYFDFDGPTAGSNIMGGRTLGNGIETSVATGDSGSPAFVVDSAGHLLLAGINTFRFGTALTFGNGGGGQLIAPYADWIATTIQPVPEPSSAQLMLPALGIVGWVAMRRRKTLGEK